MVNLISIEREPNSLETNSRKNVIVEQRTVRRQCGLVLHSLLGGYPLDPFVYSAKRLLVKKRLASKVIEVR